MKQLSIQTTLIALSITCLTGITYRAQATIFNSPSSLQGPDTLITFETGSTALPGVPNVGFNGGDATFSPSLFGSQVFGNLSTFQGYTALAIQFASPVTEVGGYVGFIDSDGFGRVQANVYGPNNQLLESTTFLPAQNFSGNPPSYVGFFEAQGISEITWTPQYSGFMGVDNVSFGGPAIPPVPEPRTVTIGVLLCGLIIFRRQLSAQKSRQTVSS